jgi:ABC-2 type transport system ATP-binding protein
VGVVRGGRLLAVGTPTELRLRLGRPRLEVLGRRFPPDVLQLLGARDEVAAARLENGGLVVELRGDVSTAPLIRLLVEEGAEIEEARRSRASLEDAFLSLVEDRR